MICNDIESAILASTSTTFTIKPNNKARLYSITPHPNHIINQIDPWYGKQNKTDIVLWTQTESTSNNKKLENQHLKSELKKKMIIK